MFRRRTRCQALFRPGTSPLGQRLRCPCLCPAMGSHQGLLRSRKFHRKSREKCISIQDVRRGSKRGEWVHSGQTRPVYIEIILTSDPNKTATRLRVRTSVTVQCQLLCISESLRVSIVLSPKAQPLTSSSTPLQSLHTAHDQSCRAVERSERVRLILKTTYVSDVRNQGVVRVGISQQRTD